MAYTRRAVIALALVAACGFSLGETASAAPVPKSDLVKLKVARHPDGPFRTCLRVNLVVDESKNVYIRVRSLSGQDESAVLDGIVVNPGLFTVKYFRNSGTEITDAVLNTMPPFGYEFVVHEQPRFFRAKVKQAMSNAVSLLSLSAFDVEDAASFANVPLNQPPNACVA